MPAWARDEPGVKRAAAVPDPSLPVTPTDGLRQRRGYVAVAPGVVGVGFYDAPFFYVWGLEGGYHLPAGKRFAAQLGGFFEHAVGRTIGGGGRGDTSRYNVHRLRLGPQVRLGGGNQRVFGYAVIRLGIDIDHVVVHDERGTRRNSHPFFLASMGAGVQGLIKGKVLLGGEVSPDISPLGGSTDEGGAENVDIMLRVRLFVGFMF